MSYRFDDQMPVLRRISRLEKKKAQAKWARQPFSSLSLESPMDVNPGVNLEHLEPDQNPRPETLEAPSLTTSIAHQTHIL
jgi:hypothetical protein